MPLTMAEIRSDVRTRLGDGGVEVELTDAQITSGIVDAVRKLARVRPPLGQAVLPVAGNKVDYAMAAYVRGVIAVDAVGPGAGGVPANGGGGTSCGDCGGVGALINAGIGGSASPLFLGGGAAAGDTGGDYVQQLNEAKDLAAVGGTDFDWDVRTVGGVLTLFVAGLTPGSRAQYTFARKLTPDDDANTGVATIPDVDVDWVIDYATAAAKQVLGRVLRKHGGGVNMPDGSTESLDGGELVSEGKQEQEQLLETLRKRRRVVLPQVG